MDIQGTAGNPIDLAKLVFGLRSEAILWQIPHLIREHQLITVTIERTLSEENVACTIIRGGYSYSFSHASAEMALACCLLQSTRTPAWSRRKCQELVQLGRGA